MTARAKHGRKYTNSEAAPGDIDIISKLAETQYRDGEQPEGQEIVLTIKDKIVGTMGNFCVISGQPKARKSTVTQAIIGSAITDTPVLDFRARLPKHKPGIVLLDTEQSRYDHCRSINRMKGLADITGELPKRFRAYNTRHFTPNENKMALSAICAMPDVGMIVIDGILDLIMDFNDIVECKLLIDQLKYVTEKNNVFVLLVLHQSKGSTNTIGHLGSFCDRFSQATIDVVKHEDGVTEVKPKFMRSDEHFEPVPIYWNYNINNYAVHWTDYTPPKKK